MISTEKTVREEVVKAIKAIAKTDLGFADDSKIFDYLKEYHQPEHLTGYLSANLASGKKSFQAWGVQVIAADESLRAHPGMLYSRLYEVTIKGYYKLTNGEDFNILQDHARKIRGALKLLGIRFNHTVDGIRDISPLSIDIEQLDDDRLLVGSIVYRLESFNPDY
jgi:hypothetical protein